MSNINEHIQSLIDDLKKDYDIPSYIYGRKPFIPGETPVYYSSPYFDDKEVVAAIRTLLIGKWMSAGTDVKKFEHLFSKEVKQLFSVMVNSGSSANLIMIASLKKYYNWNDGDEIIISVVGFPTSYSVIVQNNLVPVFVDIELDTLNFDLEMIQSKITNKTRAIFLSPVLGFPPDMDKLISICDSNNIRLILDNCDSLGTTWDKYPLSEYAVASSCSFYAAHEICTFEGGMVSTNIKGVEDIARSLISWGRQCGCHSIENLLPNGICNHRFDTWLLKQGYDGVVDHRYVFENMGYNLKPLEISGSIGIEQLKKLDDICSRRKYSRTTIKNIFDKYVRLMSQRALGKANVVPFGTAFICSDKEQKHKLVSYLEQNKIVTRNYFAGNILLQPAYSHLGNYKDYPNANKVLDLVFFIGASPHYTKPIFDYIENVMGKYI